MTVSRQLRKLIGHLEENGFADTAGAVYNHVERSIVRRIDGTPGYYRAQWLRLRRLYEESAITPVWVSPTAITNLTGRYERRDDGHLDYVPHFKPREASWTDLDYEQEIPYGTVKSGDWDRGQEPFSNLLMYQGTKQRFVEGRNWDETIYYGELVDRFREQGWDDADAEALAIERCNRIETTYERIDRDGYRSQRELNGHPLHEVTVTIGRDGNVLYNCEGRHRLCVAKVLGIEAIPVLVLARHESFEGTIESSTPRGEQR